MEFSDTSTKDGIIQDIEDRLQLGNAAISGNSKLLDTFTRYVNNRYREAQMIWLESQDEGDFTDINNPDFPIGELDLADSQRWYEINVTQKFLKLDRLDVSYDGTNFYKAVPVSPLEMNFGMGDEDKEDDNFSQTQPAYDLRGDYVALYPRADAGDVTAGAKMQFQFVWEVTKFSSSDTTTKPALPSAFHPYLSIGASLDYAVAKSLQAKNDLSELLTQQEQRMRKFAYSQNEDRQITATPYMPSNYGK